ncbi:hypothetical protein J2P12_07930, partial [Candidatus Bathyarchaeota archaeon]|nr:hypothetical protein [Candidatus Bathyarchaeota archaeon]
ASIGSSSVLSEHTSLFRSLTESLGLAASSFRERLVTLTASIGSNSSPAVHNLLFRSLTDTIGLTGAETKGLAEALSTSLGQVSGLVEQSSFFRSLTGSFNLASGPTERRSLSVTLTDTLGFDGSQSKGFAGTLTVSLGATSSLAQTPIYTRILEAGFNATTPLSGHFDCRENLTANCGSSFAPFAFLVIILGFVLFGIYAIKQRREPPSQPIEAQSLEPSEVYVDKEGWETKISNDQENDEGIR